MNTDNRRSDTNSEAFACDMTAIAPDKRNGHKATTEKLFRAVQEIRELTNGYCFRLPNESGILVTAAEFITLEQLCCPFFRFSVQVEPKEAVWLSLTGPQGVKPFIIAEISEHLPVRIQR